MGASFIDITSVLLIVFTNEVLGKQVYFARRLKTNIYENIDVYDFETLTVKGIKDCIELCKVKKLCKFINFDNPAKLCFLIGVENDENVQSEYSLEVKPGFYFGDKMEWNMEDNKICENCSKYGVCKNDADNEFPTCLDSGCEQPENKRNTIFLGNMFSVGNRIEYECMEGYKTNKTVPLTSMCLENGTWSSVEVECLPDAVFGDDVHRFENKFYKFSQHQKSWDSAKESCKQLRGKLVHIESQEENDFIVTVIKQIYRFNFYWIGGRRIDGVLTWLDGTNFDDGYTNWSDGQPDSSQGEDDCVDILIFMDYKWNDALCYYPCYFICEFI